MVPLLITNLVILIGNSFQTEDQPIFQPFGPHMCELLCDRQVAGSTLIFDKVQLTCQLVVNPSTSCSSASDANHCDVSHVQFDQMRPELRKPDAPKTKTTSSATIEGNLTILLRDLEQKQASKSDDLRKQLKENIRKVRSAREVKIKRPGLMREISRLLIQLNCLQQRFNKKYEAIHAQIKEYSELIKALGPSNKEGITRQQLCFPNWNSSVDSAVTIPNKEEDVCPPAEVRRVHEACRKGNLLTVKNLLCSGVVDVNCRGQRKHTAVMEAVGYWEENIIGVFTQEMMFNLLVKLKCNLTIVDASNNTVLHHACNNASIYIVKKLLDTFNFDVESRGQRGLTTLMSAAWGGHWEVMELLMERGADIRARDTCKDTILHFASKSNNLETFQNVLSLNITEIDSRGMDGQTPLMIAVYSGCTPVTRLLVERNASVSPVDWGGNNMLHLACSGGHLDMVKYLVTLKELRDSEKKKNRDGKTPVVVAEERGFSDIVSFLKTGN